MELLWENLLDNAQGMNHAIKKLFVNADDRNLVDNETICEFIAQLQIETLHHDLLTFRDIYHVFRFKKSYPPIEQIWNLIFY